MKVVCKYSFFCLEFQSYLTTGAIDAAKSILPFKLINVIPQNINMEIIRTAYYCRKPIHPSIFFHLSHIFIPMQYVPKMAKNRASG